VEICFSKGYQPSKITMVAELSPYRLLLVVVALLSIGTTGFYSIDGMIDKDASGRNNISRPDGLKLT